MHSGLTARVSADLARSQRCTSGWDFVSSSVHCTLDYQMLGSTAMMYPQQK